MAADQTAPKKHLNPAAGGVYNQALLPVPDGCHHGDG